LCDYYLPALQAEIRSLRFHTVYRNSEFERLNRAAMDANPPLEVTIACTYTLASAAKAHERIEEGHVLGKILLRISQASCAVGKVKYGASPFNRAGVSSAAARYE